MAYTNRSADIPCTS